ncbi:hypothetical protein STVA_43570 [Allostella vacuolata]|nr:hypothetical protein STVA_43570 [Stella vacuolata]
MSDEKFASVWDALGVRGRARQWPLHPGQAGRASLSTSCGTASPRQPPRWGFSELTIAGLLGHTVPGVTARYARVPDGALVIAADRVSARIAAALAGEKEAAKVIELPRRGRAEP